jgi:hypothetical protein
MKNESVGKAPRIHPQKFFVKPIARIVRARLIEK